jgi:ATP-dependent DNA helicase RecG
LANFYHNKLPFDLTEAQKRVVREIRKDMQTGQHMNRLLQGDVGSGKTLVALITMLIAQGNGFQSALLAPTEILSAQHYETIVSFLADLPIRCALLTGSVKRSQRRPLLESLANGEIDLLIGTHALLEDEVVFKNLGLVVIDEQHRFGVAQRAKMRKKNTMAPHVLVMTATPIPRTLAMTFYGDLDVSVIDELPPGRKPIQTIHRFDSHRLQLHGFMREQIAKGRQIYVVYPLIDESETLDFKSLSDGFEAISRAFPLPEYQVSIVHGKLKPEVKEYEMKRFVEGITNIMVATTVIEVGVNVPNATVMVIESAQRFGLSQLHQLRGRVGRGAEKSYCILMTNYELSKEAKKRMETMVETTDGFKIAEVDLSLRGPGDLLGTQQSGALNLKVADLSKDQHIVSIAREAATQLYEQDPSLTNPLHANLRAHMLTLFQNKPQWDKIA